MDRRTSEVSLLSNLIQREQVIWPGHAGEDLCGGRIYMKNQSNSTLREKGSKTWICNIRCVPYNHSRDYTLSAFKVARQQIRKWWPLLCLHAPSIRADVVTIACSLQHQSTASMYVILVVNTQRAREREQKSESEQASERAWEREWEPARERVWERARGSEKEREREPIVCLSWVQDSDLWFMHNDFHTTSTGQSTH